jgi:hypothetical protein
MVVVLKTGGEKPKAANGGHKVGARASKGVERARGGL